MYDPDHLSILAADEGAMVWGFAHESVMSPYAHDDDPRTMGNVMLSETPVDLIWPGVLDELPPELFERYEAVRDDPLAITWAAWWHGGCWVEGAVERPPGPDPDGREFLCMQVPITTARCMREFDLPLQVIEAVVARAPMTEELLRVACPTIRPSFVDHTLKMLRGIGYPVADSRG